MSLADGYWVTPAHVILAGIALPVLDIVAVAIRYVARRKQRQRLGPDDWLMIPALLFTVGIGVAMTNGASKDALAHPLELPAELNGDFLDFSSEQISIEGAIQWAYTLLLPLSLGCTKASFLFFYRRIFVVNRRDKNNMFISGMIVFVLSWMLGFLFAFLFQCRTNFWALWTTPNAIAAHCVSDTPINLAFTITDFIGDVIIFIIPIPMVDRLPSPNQPVPRSTDVKFRFGELISPGAKKSSITGVFLFGAITVAASLTRLVLTAKIFVQAFETGTDPILIVTAFIYWGMVESGVAVSTACLPNFWLIFRGWSSGPVFRFARSIAESSASRIRLSKTKTSSATLARGVDPSNSGATRKFGSSTESATARIHNNKSQDSKSSTTASYPLEYVHFDQQ
ncbi:hypothetical protein F5Y17DRAFT_461445 [Xylariaceae sp. FL0594]|nr:hypothetical protein F5Y17DRAFT_461445 [Xylariaceae sp. FL0594]